MALEGSTGAEYSGSTAGKRDPDVSPTAALPAAGVTHIAAFDANSLGSYAWRRDFTAATGVAARFQMNDTNVLSGATQKFAASGVRKITQPSGCQGSGGTVTYGASSVTDSARSEWASAVFTKQKIYAGASNGFTSANTATSVNVYQDVGLTTLGWNGGTPANGTAYKIVPAESVYIFSLQYGGPLTEAASLRVADDGSGNLVWQAWYQQSGVMTQQGSNTAVSLGTPVFVGLYVDLGTVGVASGALTAYVSTQLIDPGCTNAAVVDVSSLTGPPGQQGASWYDGHNATKGRNLVLIDDSDDSVFLDSASGFGSGAWSVVNAKTDVRRFYVTSYALPNGAGTNQQYTIGAGGDGVHQYTCLDETTTAMPDGDTSYIDANITVAGHFDSDFTFPSTASLGVNSDDIILVASKEWAILHAGTTVNFAEYQIDRGTQTFPTTPLTQNLVATSYLNWYAKAAFQSDKNGNQWTRATLDAATFGMRAGWNGSAADVHWSEVCLKIVFRRQPIPAPDDLSSKQGPVFEKTDVVAY